MTDKKPSSHDVFTIHDADTHIRASIVTHVSLEQDVVISQVDEFRTVIISLADFRRMAAAIERAV
jgi:hypothetical protein